VEARTRNDDGASSAPAARERAYRQLRERLITLDLPPGSPIDLPGLMRAYGLSRTPVMEAIQRLAQEDLLAIHPRRGTVVTQPTLSQAKHVMEVRDVFEGRAARLAAQRATEQDLAEMEALLAQQVAEREEADYAKFLHNDYQLHVRVAEASGNPLLVRALDHLLALNSRLWFVFFRMQGPQARYLFSHEPIFRAIERRDPDAAERAAVDHVHESLESLLGMFHLDSSIRRPIEAASNSDGPESSLGSSP
jgi:DNA-binding GntR family transcriptional regulator